MLRYRTQGTLAVGLGILAAGCLSEPDLKTNLRPEGDPEVLAVLAIDSGGAEAAAFCKYVGATLDEKGPGLVQGVQICPTAQADFTAPAELDPLGWGIRIMFDELLRGDDVETLDCDLDDDGAADDPLICEGHIDTTLPLTMDCGGTSITYDGYYYPNGNKESFPVGPAIVAFSFDTSIATGTPCTITINPVVKDKDGNTVATGAGLGTFNTKLQDLTVVGTDPEDAEAVEDRGVIAGDGAIVFGFNALIDEASIAAADFEIVDSAGAVVASDFAVADNAIEIFGAAALAPGQYTARLNSGAVIAEVNGGDLTLAADVDVRFVVE